MTNHDFGRGKEAGFIAATETIDTSKNVQARSIWTDIGEAVVKTAIGIGKNVVSAPNNTDVYAHARTYGYSAPAFDYVSNQDNTGGFDHIKYIAKYVDPIAKSAEQAWLQKITESRGKYVFGAAVLGGENRGIYAHDGLLENAGRYVKTEDDKYLPAFAEAILTVGKPAGPEKKSHERAHLDGVIDETAAETYAVDNLCSLGLNDPFVGKALNSYLKNFKGFSLN